VTYGQWKGKAIYIDFELIKVDDKGFKEWELEERKEMLTTFYKTYDPSKSAAKISELVEKAGRALPANPASQPARCVLH
jgi:starvation-inducible outer membrane lipoprotein